MFLINGSSLTKIEPMSNCLSLTLHTHTDVHDIHDICTVHIFIDDKFAHEEI